MHILFFSEPEAVPITKAIGHQLSRMLTYHETACGNKAKQVSPLEMQQSPGITPSTLGAAWQVAALLASISLAHNWAATELVLSCSDLSTAIKIPLGCSSSTFPWPTWRVPVLVLLAVLSVSWKAGAAQGLVLSRHLHWVPQHWGLIQLAV